MEFIDHGLLQCWWRLKMDRGPVVSRSLLKALFYFSKI